MMFIWCSYSGDMGFMCFFSSSLILFLSSASNLLLLSDFFFLSHFVCLVVIYWHIICTVHEERQSYRDCGIESIRLLGQRTKTCEPIHRLITHTKYRFVLENDSERQSYKPHLGDSRQCSPCKNAVRMVSCTLLVLSFGFLEGVL